MLIKTQWFLFFYKTKSLNLTFVQVEIVVVVVGNKGYMQKKVPLTTSFLNGG